MRFLEDFGPYILLVVGVLILLVGLPYLEASHNIKDDTKNCKILAENAQPGIPVTVGRVTCMKVAK